MGCGLWVWGLGFMVYGFIDLGFRLYGLGVEI